MLWDVDPTWQVFGNISRSAEVPSFGESVAPNFLNPTCPPFRSSTSSRRPRPPMRSARAARRPDYAWELALYRADIRDELQCLFSAFGNCNVTNADRTMHQGIEAGAGAAVCRKSSSTTGRSRTASGSTSPTPQRLPLRQRCNVRQQPVCPARRRTTSAPKLLYKHPERLLVRPEHRVGAEGLFRRQRQHADDGALYAVGPQGGLRRRRTFRPISKGAISPNKAYISSASIIDRANPGATVVRAG